MNYVAITSSCPLMEKMGQSLRWIWRGGPENQWHHDACVRAAQQVGLDVQEVAGFILKLEAIETGHQKRRYLASGNPLASTEAFELSRVSALVFSHCSRLLRLTASLIAASADREILMPSAFTSFRIAQFKDTVVGFRVDLLASATRMIAF